MQHIYSFAAGAIFSFALTIFFITKKKSPNKNNEFLEELRQLSSKPASPDHCYDLWKYYAAHADDVKEKLWTTVTWLAAINGALLAFMVKEEFVVVNSDLSLQPPIAVMVLVLFGLLLSWYSVSVTLDGVKHIQNNWFYAERMRKNESDKAKRLCNDGKDEKRTWKERLSNFPQFLAILILFFSMGIAYLVLLVVPIVQFLFPAV